MLMVKAGPAVDGIIETLIPMLHSGDVIIDGGNTQYSDTERRTKQVEAADLSTLGPVFPAVRKVLKGPSLMPGGSTEAWPLISQSSNPFQPTLGPTMMFPAVSGLAREALGIM